VVSEQRERCEYDVPYTLVNPKEKERESERNLWRLTTTCGIAKQLILPPRRPSCLFWAAAGAGWLCAGPAVVVVARRRPQWSSWWPTASIPAAAIYKPIKIVEGEPNLFSSRRIYLYIGTRALSSHEYYIRY
jgi:hypothetical protein